MQKSTRCPCPVLPHKRQILFAHSILVATHAILRVKPPVSSKKSDQEEVEATHTFEAVRLEEGEDIGAPAVAMGGGSTDGGASGTNMRSRAPKSVPGSFVAGKKGD